MVLIGGLGNQAGSFQSLQSVGKNIGRNALGRILKFPIGDIASQQVPDDQQ
jgi:hypothetical protein